MKKLLIFIALLILFTSSAFPQGSGKKQTDDTWTSDFSFERADLGPTGRNPFFILEPGYTLTLAADDEQLVITVTNETRVIDGVQTRVVEERESEDGKLKEISRNFFAISRRTNSVYYFGEEVDIYENGKIVKHDGAWLSGEKDARFGLYMPGLPLLNARYFQEIAPGVAMDRGEVISLTETIKVPAGEFKNCLKTEDSSQIDPRRSSSFTRPASGSRRKKT